jgi:hypothetical protein
MICSHRLILPVLALLMAPHALGVIAAKTPPSTLYGSCPTVVVGTVTKVDPASGNVEASAKAARGTSPGDVVRFKIDNLPDVTSKLKPGSPFVLFVANKEDNYALHLADTWLLPVRKAPTLFLVQSERDLKQSYPGTTTALLRILESIQSKSYTMLNEVSPSMFTGAAKPFGKIDGAGAATLFALKPSGRPPVVFAAVGDSFKRFDVSPEGLKPGRRSISENPTDLLAISLAGSSFFTLKKNGQLSVPVVSTAVSTTTPPVAATKSGQLWSDGTASTAAFGNFGEEPDKLYAIVVKDDNIYRYPLDGQGPPADFVRLTGERISNYHKENPRWLAGATAAPLDCNGDGRTDLLINTPSGPLLLINRGFGAFFINADLGKVLKTPAGEPLLTGKTLWTAADVDGDGLDDLLIVAPDGAVTAVLNPKPEKKE